MARGLMAGATDYSHQSLDDMISDLQDWIHSLNEVCELLQNSYSRLVEKDYLKNVDDDVLGDFAYSQKFFETSIDEINSILTDLKNEIEPNHVIRLKSLAKTAAKIDKDLARSWHQDPWGRYKDYGNPDFQLVENMYRETRGMAVDMIDLSNLSARLQDFVGKKMKKDTLKSNPWISGSFYLTVFVVVIVIMLIAAKMISLIALPIVIIGGLLALSIIGAFQLRQDNQLSQKNFVELMALSFKYLPWLKSQDNKKR
jgi:hypothetical protein